MYYILLSPGDVVGDVMECTRQHVKEVRQEFCGGNLRNPLRNAALVEFEDINLPLDTELFLIYI